ncbi:hypothetical protein [uncultured Agrobacterium sp.]|uniref:hypothetical protein n=1 Tax=uncultured Agrobacterium sp. TaxID=157277 RepID=UPI002590419F|nr:hypothetical protein [uncultured Agrobacterium sp.]
MTIWICNECGAHYETSGASPSSCLICEDDRQFVPLSGQKWLRQDDLSNHANDWREMEPDLVGIGITPGFAIGQRALLVRTPQGNVLWDCVPLLDRQTKDCIQSLGGLTAIAISHPHFYTGMAEWSEAFGNAPIYISALDRDFVTRENPNIRYVEEDAVELLPGLNLHRLGGHFPGSSVLEWKAGAEGRGALLTGDTIQATAGNVHASFMYSFPNLLPLPAREVERIANRVEHLTFDRLYAGWYEKVISKNAKSVVLDSAKQYVERLVL